MITGHEQNWHTSRCESLERGECRFDQPRGDAASVQQVAAVDDHIDFAGARRLEGALEVLKEVVPASAPDYSRARRPSVPHHGFGASGNSRNGRRNVLAVGKSN